MKMTCNLPDHAAAVNALLEGFVRVCQLCIESGLAPAHPREANVQYKLEPPGQEDWKLPQNVIRDGWGDCEDMAGWAAGGYRATGEDPEAKAEVRRTGPHKLHCVVVRGDGSVEDPSHELWQRQPEGMTSVLGDPKIIDHRKGIKAAVAKQWRDAIKSGKYKLGPEATKVIDPDTGQVVDDRRGAGWQGTSTSSQARTAAATAVQQARQDEQQLQQQEQQQYGGMQYDPTDPNNPWDNPQGYADAYGDPNDPYGYGYGGYGGYGAVDPSWRGVSDWVDPRAAAAFGMGPPVYEPQLTYDDNLSPIDQLIDEGDDDAQAA